MKFSERIGVTTPKCIIQKDSMDQDLRNGIWDVYCDRIFKRGFIAGMYGLRYTQDWADPFFKSLWHDFFKWPVDACPFKDHDVLYDHMRKFILGGEWFAVYDLIDFTTQYLGDEAFDRALNQIFKRELSAYRVVDHTLVPVVNEIQIESIEKAIKDTDKFEGVNLHLKWALQKLSDRKNPDFRNSIKDSILAVEAICQIIARERRAKLSTVLKMLESKGVLHGALKEGFSSIYGYTSDADGIRHALLKSPQVESEDALFFLVSCSAFTSYLIQKCERSNIKLDWSEPAS
jgi:hypothetical protein